MKFLAANILEALGIDGWAILFYTINLIVLVGGLVLLLYRPVKRMLKNKRDTIDAAVKENEKLKAESDAVKAEYEKKLEDIKLESAKVAAETSKAAQERSDAIIEEANQKAKSIIDSAKQDAMSQREQLKEEYRDSVNRLAVNIAQKVLEREISEKDNDALIEQVLSDWEDAD